MTFAPRPLRHALCVAALFAACSAQASTTVFSDSFEASARGLNLGPAGWTVSGGTVDVVGPGLFGELCLGSGNCLDLDGSTGQAGELSRSIWMDAGVTYTLSFDIAGNRRNAGTEQVRISLAGGSNLISLIDASPTAAWQHLSLSRMTSVSGFYTLSFQNIGGDNMGAMLDNVAITAVPEPGAAALLLAGLAGVAGVNLRRRRAD